MLEAWEAGLDDHFGKIIFAEVAGLPFAIHGVLNRRKFALVLWPALIITEKLDGYMAIKQIMIEDVAIAAHTAVATLFALCRAVAQPLNSCVQDGFPPVDELLQKS